MRQLITILMLFSTTILYAQPVNIISFNIRFNNPTDGENAWPNRIEMTTGLLRFHDADIFGLQEALIGQIKDIHQQLPDYAWFGVGRNDGKEDGEFTPVFYKKRQYNLLDHNTFWLSEIPDKPGKSWDAALNRIVTWGLFEQIASGKKFFVFNTHFDHVGVEARKNSALLIEKRVREMTRNLNIPVFVTGDFNLTPDQEPIILLKKYLKDSFEITVEPPYGPVGTFNGFNLKADLSSRRIDYIFVNNTITVLKYAVLSDFTYGRFPSDHLPVFIRAELN